MDERRDIRKQRRALRPSQLRLGQEDNIGLPARLSHIQNLPWISCYKNQLKAENKSKNTQKSYASALRSLVETILPGENVINESEYEKMTILFF